MNTITLQEYIDGTVARTLKHPTLPPGHADLIEVWGIGLGAEAGELADLVKKYLGHGHPLKREDVLKELGDVCWYATALALTLGGTDGPAKIWATHSREFPPKTLGRATRELLLAAAFGGAWSVDGVDWAMGELDEVTFSIRAFCALLPEPITVEEVWAANAAKLRERYPDGFDPKRSQARLVLKADNATSDLVRAARVLLASYKAHLLEGGYRHAPASTVDDLESALKRVEAANG